MIDRVDIESKIAQIHKATEDGLLGTASDLMKEVTIVFENEHALGLSSEVQRVYDANLEDWTAANFIAYRTSIDKAARTSFKNISKRFCTRITQYFRHVDVVEDINPPN